MIRNSLGVIMGAVTWSFVFLLFGVLASFVWPAYAEKGRIWFDTGVYEFSALMSSLNALWWALAALGGGFVAVLVSRRPGPCWVLAGLLMLFMSVNHLYLEWDRFPWWYNLAVTIPVIPAVLLGGRFAGPFARS